MARIEIKQATKNDFEFICKCIIESEKSGSSIFSYNAIFDLNETQFIEILDQIFDEDVEDQPWCYQHWTILFVDGLPASGLCSWIEGMNDLSSDVLKTQLLNFMIPTRFVESMEKLKIVSTITIPRKKNTLQLEHLFTKLEYRGQGLMRQLIQYILMENRSYNAEIQLMQNNIGALSLYTDIGFIVNETKCNQDIERLNLLSDSCKVNLIFNHE